MAFATPATTLLADIDTHNVTRFLLEPALNYDNILQSGPLTPFRIESNVKDKLKMLHLKKPKFNLQPKTDCDTWKPSIRYDLKPNEIGVCDFELMGEQCADEFDSGTLRNLQGDDVFDPTGSPELSAMDRAMLLQLRQGISDDLYRIGWFADADFGTGSYPWGTIDLQGMGYDPKVIEFMQAMMRNCDGWWSELYGRAQSTDPNRKIIKFDSNDGTADGNATNPNNIADFLKDMLMGSPLVLRNWNKARPRSEWPVFMLQPGLYNSYIEYLEAKGTEKAHMMEVVGEDGSSVGVYTFRGYPVLEVADWDSFDNEVGLFDATTGMSKKQRAIFTVRENLTIAHGYGALDSNPSSGLMIQKSPLLKDKQKVWTHMALRIGFGLAHNHLISISYNSSDTYQ